MDTSHLDCYFMGLPVKKAPRKYHLQPIPQRVLHSRKKLKRMQALASSAPSEECIQCHDPSTTSTSTEVLDGERKMLDASLGSMATRVDMVVQMLHETARMFQVAIEKEKSLTNGPWFTKAWLGIDHNAWVKAVAYQAAVHALIEAALDIARRQEDKNFTASSFVQQSLSHLRNPLEVSIRQHLSARDAAAEAWFWTQQLPVAVSNLISTLKRGDCVAAFATIDPHKHPQILDKDLDSTLFMLSLSIFASIMKFGPRKLSCSAFSLSLAEETSHLMDAFVESSSINEVYQFTSSIGLTNEFLKHFSLRAALHCGDPMVVRNERLFWIDLIQKSLRGSLAREGLYSKLSSSAKCEILEHNLAVFGFFAALGRRARFFLASKKVHFDDRLLSLFRYLEGGNVIFYSELATLSTYQLFVEVASEELEWIPFFDNTGFGNTESSTSGKSDAEKFPSSSDEVAETIAAILNVFSCWVDDFMLYNERVQRVQTVVTTKFLSNIQSILCDCIAATNRRYRRSDSNKIFVARAASELEQVLSSKDLTHTAFRDKAKKSLQHFKWDGVLKGPSNAKSMPLDIDLLQVQDHVRAFDESMKSGPFNDWDGTHMPSKDDKAYITEYKSWNFLSKSTKKLKDASMDVLKGTQLLVTDVAVAITLIKRRVAGHTLTEREIKILLRTCTDLASIIPIGFLMLLPVTAVGHAAMLAAIQKYVPALIPSAYAPERLDLLKQLEHLRKMNENVPGYLNLPPEESSI